MDDDSLRHYFRDLDERIGDVQSDVAQGLSEMTNARAPLFALNLLHSAKETKQLLEGLVWGNVIVIGLLVYIAFFKH